MRTLVTWIGMTDLKAARGVLSNGVGPIGSAIEQMQFEHLCLLADIKTDDAELYRDWVSSKYDISTSLHPRKLSSPTAFKEIYEAATGVIEDFLAEHDSAELAFHTSPGTPAMAAVWLILSKTRFPARAIQTYYDIEAQRSHAQVIDFPFDISAEYVGDLFREPDARLVESARALPPESPAFEQIIHRCEKMQTVIRRARRVAPRTVPVLLLGESGTGKELFARAIHRASPRRDAPFVAINCGAIPQELVESELFGHTKGAFTGAHKEHKGAFEQADGGTLFLDEVGELPLNQQVKLLRALQEGRIKLLGEEEERKVDVRLICATHCDLYRAVFEDAFREDLFHRIAVAVLELPALREREGDLTLLIETLVAQLHEEMSADAASAPIRLTPSAQNALLQHTWPGNVRELRNTLLRAMLWCDGEALNLEDIQDSILKPPSTGRDPILERSLSDDFDINHVLDEVKRTYITRALDEANQNKSAAATLLGLSSHQTLTNWMKGVGLDG